MEESFEELCVNFPEGENYSRHLHKDRHRWAAAFSVLTFSVSSFTSSRVEGGPLCIERVCASCVFAWRGRPRVVVLLLRPNNIVTCS